MKIQIEGSLVDNNVHVLSRQIESEFGLSNFSVTSTSNSITVDYLKGMSNSKIPLILTTQFTLWSLLNCGEPPVDNTLIVLLETDKYFEDLNNTEKSIFSKVFKSRTGITLPQNLNERSILSKIDLSKVIQVKQFDLFDILTVLRETYANN